MPEIIEVKLASDFVNSKSELTFTEVGFSSVTKNPKDIIPNNLGNFKIKSTTRGKEMKLTLFNSEQSISLIFQFGMSGNWKWVMKDKLEEEKHHHFRLYSTEGVLTFWDPRRFGGWRLGDWSKDRGPDPIKEFDEFKTNLEKKGKWWDKPLYEVLMDQKYFSGCGNYLRSEIIYRADINPIKTWNQLTNSERDLIVKLCRSIPLEVENLGGGQLKDWKNPEGKDKVLFQEWLSCYGKGESIIDKNGRKFWMNKKWFGNFKK
jgi:formamidopyrimidine-DNA glycosylase